MTNRIPPANRRHQPAKQGCCTRRVRLHDERLILWMVLPVMPDYSGLSSGSCNCYSSMPELVPYNFKEAYCTRTIDLFQTGDHQSWQRVWFRQEINRVQFGGTDQRKDFLDFMVLQGRNQPVSRPVIMPSFAYQPDISQPCFWCLADISKEIGAEQRIQS